MSYSLDEAALLALITTNISGYSANNTKAGDEDAAFSYAAQNGGNVCLLDYSGGQSDSQQSRMGNDDLWMWNCVVTFFILYDVDTIESSIRSIADNFTAMHRDNKRLSTGHTWRIEAARAYEIVNRNDVPFVPVSFLTTFKTPI